MTIFCCFTRFSPQFCLAKASQNVEKFKLKPPKATKYGHFMRLSIKKHLTVSDLTQKTQNWKKKISQILGPLCHPPRGTHISASRALIKNRLDEVSNLV